MRRLLILGWLAVLAGCAAPQTYYYGKYSQTLYRSAKDQTPEALAAHKKALLDVIDTTEKKNLRVPPGICLEYGYILAKEGSTEAERFFALEVKTYPESERFVSFIRTQLKAPTP